MALAAATVLEVRADGSDSNGGGFVAGASGTDRSQQAAAYKSGTGLAVHASTNTDVLPDGHTPEAADVGNLVQITAGAGWTASWYEIKSIQSGYWRLDRSPAAAGTTGGTWAMGGALKSLGGVGTLSNSTGCNTNGMRCYVREGTYTLDSATVNAKATTGHGGPYLSANNHQIIIEGYSASGGRGDWSAGPTISAGTNGSITMLQPQFPSWMGLALANLTLDGNSQTAVIGLNLTWQYNCAYLLTALNCTTGFKGSANSRFVRCKAQGCTTGFDIAGLLCIWCESEDCTTGFGTSGNGGTCVFCTSYGGTNPWGIESNTGMVLVNCTAVGGTGDNVKLGNFGSVVVNCVSTNSTGGYGYNFGTAANQWLINSAAYSNSSGTQTGARGTPGLVEITDGDPWVAAASDDYRPNATALRGALLRDAGVGCPSQTVHIDIGAVQHADPAGGGGGGGNRIFGSGIITPLELAG